MLNLRDMEIGSSSVCQWRLGELDGRDTSEKPGGIVSRDVMSFGLFLEDTLDKDDWRLRIKGATD